MKRPPVLAPAILIVTLAIGCAEQTPDSAATPSADESAPSSESNDMHTDATSRAPQRHSDSNTQHKHTNRLVNSTSPYLLQHAHNPVDWYEWGEEAFEAAREQDKPIFLSVGYSTCYWCHVMERESFESETIAAIMNEHFINIKVDREQRPDVDGVYMTAVQIFSQGRGGWPMSVFLEPAELKPFFGATYFPPQPTGGMPGFIQVLEQVAETWQKQRPQIMQQADYAASQIARYLAQPEEVKPLNAGHVQLAASQILQGYDQQHGGLANPPNYAPKFPMPTHLDLLIATDWNDDATRAAVTTTLDRMAMGGIYDQVGGGFHRYSTDRQWLVPHFEKMLYDNGQLATTYAAAYTKTSDDYYAEVLRETLDYVLREMTDASGAFYSAQDAEVDAREGLNYLWQPDEVRQVLADAGLSDDIELVFAAYGLNDPPNFQDPHHAQEPARHILHLTTPPEQLAKQFNMSLDDFNQRLHRAGAALLAVRVQRKQPGLDDKTIVSWNGLMIAGFADGGRVLQDQSYIDAGRRAAEFILSAMRTPDGGLLRIHRGGESTIDAYFEDYAMLIHGLLTLHEATGEQRWIDASAELAAAARQRFWDADHGGYYDTLADQSDLFVRTKSTRDGALPCGMSMMLHSLLTLHEQTSEQRYLDDAVATFRSLSATLSSAPASLAVAATALDRFLQKHPTAMLRPDEAAGPREQEDIVSITFTETDMDVTAADGARFEIILTIADGWHISAREPGHESLVPLNVELLGAEGLTLDVTYPPSETFTGPVGSMQVYSGAITLQLQITATETVTGSPNLVITCQPCDDTKCLSPQRQVIPLQWTDN